MNSDFKISRWLYYKYKVELQWLEYLWNHENMFETELKNVNHGKKKWRITSPTGKGSPFDSEQLL